MLLRCTGPPRPELLIVVSAPVNHEHALPLLIVIMLSAPLKPDHEFRIIVNPCIVTISAPLLPVFKSYRSCHILPSIVGPGRRYFVSCPCILLRRPGLAPCLASPGSFPAACLNRNARAHVLPKSSALGAALVLIVSCLILDRGSWRLTPPLYSSVLRRPGLAPPCLSPRRLSSPASCSCPPAACRPRSRSAISTSCYDDVGRYVCRLYIGI